MLAFKQVDKIPLDDIQEFCYNVFSMPVRYVKTISRSKGNIHVSTLDSIVGNYTKQMEEMIASADRLYTLYKNKLFSEEFAADRLFTLEDYGNITAAGTIQLRPKINQQMLVVGILVSSQANQPCSVTIGRFTFFVTNVQSRAQALAPLQYQIGPGDNLSMQWTGATDNVQNYFAAFCKLTGSHYG